MKIFSYTHYLAHHHWIWNVKLPLIPWSSLGLIHLLECLMIPMMLHFITSIMNWMKVSLKCQYLFWLSFDFAIKNENKICFAWMMNGWFSIEAVHTFSSRSWKRSMKLQRKVNNLFISKKKKKKSLFLFKQSHTSQIA